MFPFMVLAVSSLFPFLFPPPSLAGFPSCDESQATADYDILCPANAIGQQLAKKGDEQCNAHKMLKPKTASQVCRFE